MVWGPPTAESLYYQRMAFFMHGFLYVYVYLCIGLSVYRFIYIYGFIYVWVYVCIGLYMYRFMYV